MKKRIFVRYVSHEFRTPLNTISVGLELVTTTLRTIEKSLQYRSPLVGPMEGRSAGGEFDRTEGLSLVHSVQSLIDDISTSCSSSIEILDDLLLFDNIEDGQLSLRRQSVLIGQWIERWLKPFRLQVCGRSISLTHSPAHRHSTRQ
jgi:signal transduction histidine kinase